LHRHSTLLRQRSTVFGIFARKYLPATFVIRFYISAHAILPLSVIETQA